MYLAHCELYNDYCIIDLHLQMVHSASTFLYTVALCYAQVMHENSTQCSVQTHKRILNRLVLSWSCAWEFRYIRQM